MEFTQVGKNTYYSNDGAKLSTKRTYGGIDIKCNCKQGYLCKHGYYLRQSLMSALKTLEDK